MNKNKLAIYIAIFVAVIVIFLIINPFVMISAGHRGVVLEWGAVSNKVLGEGIHFIVPVYQRVVEMDVQIQKMELEIDSYSKDIQSVKSVIALNFNLKPELVNILYQEVGVNYQNNIIDPAIQESLKAATAKFTAQELIEQRPKVKDEITVELNARLNKYFTVKEFSITDFAFSEEYERAVESKQVAQQKALQAENDLKRIEIEAEQRIAEATAEAEAIRIQAESVSKQGGADYVKLKAVEKWNGVMPTHMLPNSTLPFIELK
jgi:regulator of protease activity HflC (stomatin/prohibitin superfamily)